MTSAASAVQQARTSDLDRPVGLFPSVVAGHADSVPGGARAGHALALVEFARVLELVAGHAASAAGARRVLALTPGTSSPDTAAEHARVEAMRALVAREGGWQGQPIADLGAALERLAVERAAWSGLELRAALDLLVSSRLTHRALADTGLEPAVIAPLTPLANALLREPALEKQVDRVVNEEGVVRDDASPALRKLRKELRGAEGDLVRLLERLMAKLDARHRVDDGSVTLRNGRYVIPVRREGRGVLGGIVHDTSSTGATLFVEPPAAVEAGNRIRELEAEELRETERILAEATDELRPHREPLVATLDALATLDSLFARASYALRAGCAPALLAGEGTGFRIVNGRHPLLLARDAERVVPFDLAMDPSEHTLLVSGPNTGGKTVLLKSVTLISLMVQSGIPAPVGLGSTIPVFDRFFADIGDEQSIEASLSTFSAHVRNLIEIVREATPRSLVLVDELGSGTDPVEGAALGGAILETLTRRGTTTLATTHLGALKELAHEVPGVVNASLEFDAVALAPTFRLVKGIPGRSYGLSIARRLEMPESILENAERRIPAGERDVSALLEELERRQAALDEREGATAERQADVADRADRVSERERALRERERGIERAARQEARQYLLAARQEIEATIRDLKSAGAEAVDAAALHARRTAEQLAASEAGAIASLDEAERRETLAAYGGVESGAVEPGATVSVATLGGKAGRVIELRGADAVVVVGAMKLTVPLATLRRVSRKQLPPAEVAVPLMGDQPEVSARHEVDVRGMRIGEMDGALIQAVDDAVRADLHSLRIIHGKGTGALRERVAELLRQDRRVIEFRLGLWNEGGAGVTVVSLA